MFKALALSLTLLLLNSCTSWNITADTSTVGASPLNELGQEFKVDHLGLSFSNGQQYQHAQQMNFGINGDNLKSYLYTNHPDFFSNDPTAFPIRIQVNSTLDGDMSGGHFVMYMCTLGILPAKFTNEINSQIDIAPAYSNHASMFRLAGQHKVSTTGYLTAFSPIGWFMGDEPQGENQALSHKYPQAPEKIYQDLYYKYVAQQIISKLSSLQLEIVEPTVQKAP